MGEKTQGVSYRQPSKSEVRSHVLGLAVRALTLDRPQSTVIQPVELRQTVDFALSQFKHYRLNEEQLRRLQKTTESALSYWQEGFNTSTGSRNASELRVLYLAGPEPLNDLKVLVGTGVRPSNVWAVESDRETFRAAKDAIERAGVPINLHHGDLATFFENVNEAFDIIYYDGTAPFAGGSPNSIRPLLQLFVNRRLTPISTLITTFAEPGSARAERARYVDLCCAFFRSRYNGLPYCLNKTLDPAEFRTRPERLRNFVSKHLSCVYSDFVTRLLIMLARNVVPSARALGSADVSRYLLLKKSERDKVVKSLVAESSSELSDEAVLRSLASNTLPDFDFLRHLQNNPTDPLAEALRQQRVGSSTLADLALPAALLAHYNPLEEGWFDVTTAELKDACSSAWFDGNSISRFSCDLPYPNLLINSLLGKYGYPCFANPRKSVRLSYTAKKTEMYVDLLLFDQCRYYFDWLPTIATTKARFKDIAFQILTRCLLDRIGWHDGHTDDHPFRYSAVPCCNETPSARFYNFSPRRPVTPTSRCGAPAD